METVIKLTKIGELILQKFEDKVRTNWKQFASFEQLKTCEDYIDFMSIEGTKVFQQLVTKPSELVGWYLFTYDIRELEGILDGIESEIENKDDFIFKLDDNRGVTFRRFADIYTKCYEIEFLYSKDNPRDVLILNSSECVERINEVLERMDIIGDFGTHTIEEIEEYFSLKNELESLRKKIIYSCPNCNYTKVEKGDNYCRMCGQKFGGSWI